MIPQTVTRTRDKAAPGRRVRRFIFPAVVYLVGLLQGMGLDLVQTVALTLTP